MRFFCEWMLAISGAPYYSGLVRRSAHGADEPARRTRRRQPRGSSSAAPTGAAPARNTVASSAPSVGPRPTAAARTEQARRAGRRAGRAQHGDLLDRRPASRGSPGSRAKSSRRASSAPAAELGVHDRLLSPEPRRATCSPTPRCRRRSCRCSPTCCSRGARKEAFAPRLDAVLDHADRPRRDHRVLHPRGRD